MRVVGYRRVSTAEQVVSGAGLEAQLLSIEGAVESRGWELVGEGVDRGVSGGVPWASRPGMRSALGMLAAGEADVLMAARLDRVARSAIDFLGFVDLAERGRREGRRWVLRPFGLVVLDLAIDTTTPVGRFTATVLAAVAELERSMIRDRTRASVAARRVRGAPDLMSVETRARIETLRGDGLSFVTIAARLEAAGVPTVSGRPWNRGSVQRACRGLRVRAA